MKSRTDIINYLINKNQYISYLEIGINNGYNYKMINCKLKRGVEPDSSRYKGETIFSMTSDKFFENFCDQKFDIIFIDGLHLEDQVDKDVLNSLKFLSNNGTIVLHDCNPPTIHHAREDINDMSTPAKGSWNGTVWRSIVKLRMSREDLDICVVDTDWGCGILRVGQNRNRIENLVLEDCLTWDFFDKNRNKILNLISTKEFLENF